MVLVAAVLCLSSISTAGPAGAHAHLETTDPLDGTRLDQAPATVTLTFAESVLLRHRSLEVVDHRGRHVETGAAFYVDGSRARVAVRLRPSLPDDSYTVRFGIVSPDGHPVTGAFTFVVGTGVLRGVNGVPAGDTEADRSVGLLYGLGRWLAFCGLAVLGGLIFISTCWPSGAVNARARRVLRLGWLSATLGSVLSLLLFGPYATGQGLSTVLSPGSFGQTLDLPVGKVVLLRLVALGALVPVGTGLLGAHVDGSEEARRRYESLGLALAVPLLIGYSGAGHVETGSQPTVLVLSDMLHLTAMALWLGGVVMLVAVMVPQARADELRTALPIYSRYALTAICLLLGTGLLQAWHQVRTPALLGQTGYGRVLLVKVVLVGLVLLVGNGSRRFVQRLGTGRASTAPGDQGDQGTPATPHPPGRVPVRTPAGRPAAPVIDRPDLDLHRLRIGLVTEVVLSAAILVLSAVLVALPPPGR